MSTHSGSKYVQGTCACGHVGKQQRPDICSPCFKAENRTVTQAEERKRIDSRVNTIKRKFKALPNAEQRYLLQEFLNEQNESV